MLPLYPACDGDALFAKPVSIGWFYIVEKISCLRRTEVSDNVLLMTKRSYPAGGTWWTTILALLLRTRRENLGRSQPSMLLYQKTDPCADARYDQGLSADEGFCPGEVAKEMLIDINTDCHD